MSIKFPRDFLLSANLNLFYAFCIWGCITNFLKWVLSNETLLKWIPRSSLICSSILRLLWTFWKWQLSDYILFILSAFPQLPRVMLNLSILSILSSALEIWFISERLHPCRAINPSSILKLINRKWISFLTGSQQSSTFIPSSSAKSPCNLMNYLNFLHFIFIFYIFKYCHETAIKIPSDVRKSLDYVQKKRRKKENRDLHFISILFTKRKWQFILDLSS